MDPDPELDPQWPKMLDQDSHWIRWESTTIFFYLDSVPIRRWSPVQSLYRNVCTTNISEPHFLIEATKCLMRLAVVLFKVQLKYVSGPYTMLRRYLLYSTVLWNKRMSEKTPEKRSRWNINMQKCEKKEHKKMDEILETKTKECETLSRKADSYLSYPRWLNNTNMLHWNWNGHDYQKLLA
jgi:hypothetical protein